VAQALGQAVAQQRRREEHKLKGGG
jgi:hypothetical protein